jgi:hypothetical protein
VFDTSIKFVLESVLGNRAKRLARLKDSVEHYLRLRKDFGDDSRWDARIEVFAHSLVFGNGRLIERQFIEFAETFAEPEQVLLLHSAICNYLDINCDDKSESIKIKPGFDTEKKRKEVENLFLFFSLGMLSVAIWLGYLIYSFYLSMPIPGSNFYAQIILMTSFSALILMILWIAPLMLFSLPMKLAALHKFDLLLKRKRSQDHNTELHQAPTKA